MRIAHVSDAFMPRLGGIERQVHDLAMRQQAAGHEVEVITAVAGTVHDSDLGVPVHRASSNRRKPPGDIQYSAWLTGAKIVRAGDFDMVHVHLSSFSPLAYMSARAAARAGIPVAATVHSLWRWTWPIHCAASYVMGWNRMPIAWSAVSSAATTDLAHSIRLGGFGGRRKPIDVLPNGVDHDAWRIEALPRNPDRVVIATVMRLAMRKRPRQFLQMLRRARAIVPANIALEVVIIGDGPRRAGIERYLARHQMTDWVRLTGRANHEQIRLAYCDADFFVAPATLESFGIAALEARSAGLPVIAHRVSGVADFVEHGRNGLLAAGDVEMAERIAELAMSPQLRAEITQHNRETVPGFGWTEVLERCDALYARAAALAGRAALDSSVKSRSKA
jgi:glycosyltransferase involved in cell wall biosynthesis